MAFILPHIKHCQGFLWHIVVARGLKTFSIAARACHTSHECLSTLYVVYLLSACYDICISPWVFFFLLSFHSVLPFLPFLCLQLCVRIEKNPGLGFSISGGISGQGNPFKPSDMVRPVPACQPITASPALPQSCHGNCCLLPQCFVCLFVCLSVGQQWTWLTLRCVESVIVY